MSSWLTRNIFIRKSGRRLFFHYLNLSDISSIPQNKEKSFSISRKCQESLESVLESQLNEMKELGTFKIEKVISSPQSSHILCHKNNTPQNNHNMTNDQDNPVMINMCANNYLGWSSHPQIIQAAIEMLKKRGAGLSSVRFICGTQDIHKDLEKKISSFHKKEDAILYPSCFDANGGIFEALFNEQDIILSDSLNHASIIDGIRLSKAERAKYEHLNMKVLEESLTKANEKGKRFKIIVTDGVFSMDGEVAPLDRICDLADKYDALVMVDDAHATGFIGKYGRGTPELFQVEDKVDFINSTLGKALNGSMGGYTAASSSFIQFLRQKSRPYLFSNSLPPAVIGSALKAFEFLLDDNSDSEAFKAREKLHHNTRYIRKRLLDAGFNMKGSDHQHPIIPLMIYDSKKALEMATALYNENIFAVPFSYPVVAKNQARIRLQISAAHSMNDLDKAIHVIVEQGKKLQLIK